MTTPDEPKMVRESDLLAVKVGLTKELDGLKSQLESALQKADTHYQELLGERASKEAVQTQLGELQGIHTQLEETKTQLEALKSKSVQDSERLLTLHRQMLVTTYGIGKELVEGKSQQELASLEEALKIVGPRKGSGIDTGASSGGTAIPLTPRDKITAGLAKKFNI